MPPHLWKMGFLPLPPAARVLESLRRFDFGSPIEIGRAPSYAVAAEFVKEMLLRLRSRQTIERISHSFNLGDVDAAYTIRACHRIHSRL